jgi:DNA-binding XRE family transcriptional regulator
MLPLFSKLYKSYYYRIISPIFVGYDEWIYTSVKWYNGITNPNGGIFMNTIERESRILRERRLELGLSQTEVALNAGLQLQHYQRYEYGDRKLSNSSMILGLRICSILELDPYEFVFGESKDWIKKVR